MRNWRPPAHRKPRILVYVEPAVFRGDPLLLASWIKSIDRWVAANSRELEFHLASSPALIAVARAAYASFEAIDPDGLLESFGGDLALYMRDICDDERNANDALRDILRAVASRVEPDIVVSWTENRYLTTSFGGARVVFTENGPLPRHGCVLVKHLDPFGHQIDSVFDRLTQPLWPTPADGPESRWIDAWLAIIRRAASAKGIDAWIDTLPRRRRVLVALQPPGWIAYEGVGAQLGPIDYLVHNAARAGADDVIVPQWHPAQPPPTELERERLRRDCPNVAIPPAAFTSGCSEHLVEHVDEIVTVSSNVALLAPLLGKRLRIDGRSKFAALGRAPAATVARRLDLVGFLLANYCDASVDWSDIPGCFARRLLAVAAEPESLLTPPRLTQEQAMGFLRAAV